MTRNYFKTKLTKALKECPVTRMCKVEAKDGLILIHTKSMSFDVTEYSTKFIDKIVHKIIDVCMYESMV